jgi:hypothetical protein
VWKIFVKVLRTYNSEIETYLSQKVKWIHIDGQADLPIANLLQLLYR